MILCFFFAEEHSPSFMSVPFQKAIFEVITMNLLFELDGRCLYKEAALLLQQFYDWDSLVSSKVRDFDLEGLVVLMIFFVWFCSC